MSDIIDCIWHAIETNNDLKISGSSSGWREAEGGGKNFKLDGTFPFREGNMAKVGNLPAIVITPTTTTGDFYSSATAKMRFSVEVMSTVKTESMDKALRFSELIHSELISHVRGSTMNFEDPGNGYTNLIHLYWIPTINFDDIKITKDWIWVSRIPLMMEISKTA